MKGRFNLTKDTLSKEQRTYLSNLFGIGGGAVLYTEWQYAFAMNEIKPLTVWQQIMIVFISVTMLSIGALFQEKDDGDPRNEQD